MVRFIDNGGLRGLSEATFVEAAQYVVREKGRCTHVFTRELLLTLQEVGYQTFVLSHSPMHLVEPMSKLWNFTYAHSSRYLVENGRFTGERHIPSKKVMLEHFMDQLQWTKPGSIVIGDTLSDLEMLKLADCPIVFSSSRGLKKAARSLGFPVVYEGKDDISVFRSLAEPGRPFKEMPLSWILPKDVATRLETRLNRLGYEFLPSHR